ncbi:uncharacterized protein [Typha angustifolia]|uniref:uncharacterized protein isoform X2 n=1 Tax=Typha angustifolia TaxID=59011 RepID=UPI003C2F03DC
MVEWIDESLYLQETMINLFDLSAGMAGNKLLMDRAHRDAYFDGMDYVVGSPIRRSRSDVRRPVDQDGVHVDDKLVGSDMRRNSSRKKSGGTPMKMLIAQEMSKDIEQKQKPRNVVARLMGLDDELPAQPPVFSVSKTNLQEGHSHNTLAGAIRGNRRQEDFFTKAMPCKIHPSSNERVEYKDVYEVWQQPSRGNHFQGRPIQNGRCYGNQNEKRMDLVRQKFMEAKRLATDEKLLQSKEFQDALEVLSSNRDLFIKFLEEPNSLFSAQINEIQTIPPPCQTKRITVLKPSKSVATEGKKHIKRQQHPTIGESGWEMSKPRSRSSISRSKAESFSQPTRIVVLKPSPRKPHDIMTKLTPPVTSPDIIGQKDFFGGLEDTEVTIESKEVTKLITQHISESCHRRDESLLSSVYSNGYGGDESSFNRSENEYMEEEGGGFSDSEIVTPTSRHSWDFVNRYRSPCSASSFSRASYSPESSVIREAKKRLSERWALVASNEINQEQVEIPRSSSTLGEMLAVHDVKKEEGGDKRPNVSSSRSCDADDELREETSCVSIGKKRDEDGESSPKNLSRSKSVPVSSSAYDNIGLNLQASNSQNSKSTVSRDVAKSNKGKSFFKGKVSNFFFSRNKKLVKEKPNLSSVGSDDKLQSSSAEARGNTDLSKSDPNSFADDSSEVNLEAEIENGSKQGAFSPKANLSLRKPAPSDYLCEDHDKFRSETPCINRDQPSPTSVLDAPFEDVNDSEPQSSAKLSNQQPLSRSSPIESVARSLSWEDAHLETPSADPPKLSRALSRTDDDDEQSRTNFVQKLLSSSGLYYEKSSTVFAGWHSLECPLNPVLLDKFLDRKEEAARCRERRSNQRLLFDCVNAALLEVAHTTLKSTYPWTNARHVLPGDAPYGAVVETEVWGFLRNWFSGEGKLVQGENDNAGIVVERVITKEVEGRGWAESMRSEVDETTREIGKVVLDELVGEALADFAVGYF